MKVSIDFDTEKVVVAIDNGMGEDATKEIDAEDVFAIADAMIANAQLLKKFKDRRDTDAEWDHIGGAN